MKPQTSHKVVLDTSFILSMLRNHRELDSEIRDSARGPVRLTTTDGVIMELQRLARSGDFHSRGLARVALSTLGTREITIRETHPSTPNVDTAILALALGDRERVDVATADRRLREACFKLGVTSICPKVHKGIEIVRGARVPLN